MLSRNFFANKAILFNSTKRLLQQKNPILTRSLANIDLKDKAKDATRRWGRTL